MRILLTSIVLLCVFSCSSKPDVASFTKQLTDSLNQAKGNFALSFRDLQTGQEIHINEHRLFHAASTMKTPVMIELYKQAGAGKFSLSDSILVKTEFNSIVDSTFSLSPESDSESELYTFAGKKRPISELVYKMIILSSNLATNILIELVDAKNVTQTMRDLGAKDILVLRGVEDGKAFRAGLNNKVTAYDLMLIFSAISDGKVEGSEDMINILLDQKFNDIIPARLPKDVKVAHKTGWITGLHHDSALVILPDGRKYVLVLLSDSLEDEEAGVKTMATVSRLIYDFLTENTE
ncbi:MAG TPA: serine hydrolase [Cyclobacteriaceae bacterium]|nr:serine hydrolase [Cyclobacteriaceae bacterium]